MVNKSLSILSLDGYLARVGSGRVSPARCACATGACGRRLPSVRGGHPHDAGLNRHDCNASNTLEQAALFVIDGKRLRRIRLSAPVDYVK
jgi:hypothetical protein